MTAPQPTPTPPSRRPRLPRTAVLVVATMLVALVVLAAVVTGPGRPDAQTLSGGSAQDRFHIDYPEDWRPLPAAELDGRLGAAHAALVRADGQGLVVVRRRGEVRDPLATLARRLRIKLDRQFPDFREVTSRTAAISGRTAHVYSYVRERKGSVHSVVIVPAGRRSYVLTTVSQAGREDVAREIGGIITSFGV